MFVPIDEVELELLLAEPELEPDPEAGTPEIEPPADTADAASADD